jgi:ABC-2 type transport system ATP-binding protein
MPDAVIAENVAHRYGDRLALDRFTLTVPEGAVFGILGPNGSGKSTFITMVAGMERPATGSLRIFGQEPAVGLRSRIGTVFQENAQDPLMSLQDHLLLAGRVFGLSSGTIRERSRELLDRFGLGGREKDRVATLSGGMRRRLEAVRALLHRPELLLLDEPTTGVDPGERSALWDGIRASGVTTVLLATNDLAEADAICDTVAFVREGHVMATGTPADLKRGLRRESIRIRWESNGMAPPLDTVASWPGVGDLSQEDDAIRLTVDDASTFVPRIFALAEGHIRGVTIEPATLEDAYFQHVGRRVPASDGVPA